MGYTRYMRLSWLTALLLAGCTVDQLPPEDPSVPARRTACTLVEGLTFRAGSVDLSFRAYSASHSQYQLGTQTGFVTCAGTDLRSDDGRIAGALDETTLELVWGDAVFSPAF